MLAFQKHNKTASSNMFPSTTANIRDNTKTTNKHSTDTAGWNKSHAQGGATTAGGSGIITEESQA